MASRGSCTAGAPCGTLGGTHDAMQSPHTVPMATCRRRTCSEVACTASHWTSTKPAAARHRQGARWPQGDKVVVPRRPLQASHMPHTPHARAGGNRTEQLSPLALHSSGLHPALQPSKGSLLSAAAFCECASPAGGQLMASGPRERELAAVLATLKMQRCNREVARGGIEIRVLSGKTRCRHHGSE